MKLKKLTKLYFKYVAQYLKSLMAYRVDFFTGLIGFSFLQITGVIFITLVFNSIPSLQGWNFYEILFIYGFAQLPRGLDHIFTDNLWLISSWLIADGDFDRYLLRPINPLFQVIAERFQMDGFGEFVIGVILVHSNGNGFGMTIRLLALDQSLLLLFVSTTYASNLDEP